MAVIAVTLASLACGLALAGRAPRMAAGLAIGAAVPWLSFVAYYAHVVDFAAYYAWRALPWTDSLAGLVGFSAGVVATRFGKWSRGTSRGVVIVSGALLALGLVTIAFAKPVLIRMPRAWIKDTWKDDVCLQSTPATCGPCAAATVLRALHINVTEGELADEAQSTTSGTLNWLLVRALRERGLHAEMRDVAAIDEVRAPAVIGVGIGKVGHFLAYLGRDPASGAYIIGEPLRGKLVMTPQQFEERYRFDAFALEIRRAP